MKTTVSTFALLILGCTHAFVAPVSKTLPRVDVAVCAERLNQMVELESPKVVTMDAVDTGGKKVYCRCWLSKTFPLCDGSHAEHNKVTGDNVGPLIVSGPKPAPAES